MEEGAESVFARDSLLPSSVSVNQYEVAGNNAIGKARAVKNLIVLCFSLFLFFLSFMSLSNLQSSMNAKDGSGVTSLAVIYAMSMVSAILLPSFFIKRIGCKSTLLTSVACSIPFIGLGLFPYKIALIPTAGLLGITAGPLTAAQAFYTNEMGRIFHRETPEEILKVVISRFFGIYSFFSANSQIWGNLISYLVFRHSMVPLQNETVEETCGVDYSFVNGTDAGIFSPTPSQRTVLLCVYIIFMIISIALLLVFLDSLDNDKERDKKCIHILGDLLAAVRQSYHLNQALLVPISIFCGLEIAFYTSDFSKAFIACSLGIYYVGYVTICLGVCGAVMALLVGPLVRCISLTPVFLLAALINVITFTMLFVWKPSADFTVPYFVFAGVWGMTDAIWWSQVPALYGLLFPNNREAAFSNFFFWAFFGYFITFCYANYITIAAKITVMLVFLITGIAGYLAVEIRVKCSPRRDYVVIADAEDDVVDE